MSDNVEKRSETDIYIYIYIYICNLNIHFRNFSETWVIPGSDHEDYFLQGHDAV